MCEWDINVSSASKEVSTKHVPVRFHVTVLHHVSLQVAGLSEGLVAHLALVGPHALVGEQVCVQMAELLKQLPTQVASMWLYAIVAQYVCDQVVLGGVGLLTHATLPSFLVTTNVHIVAVVYMDVEAELLSAGHPASGSSVASSMTRADVFSRVEGTRREVHDGPGHKKGVWEEAVVEWEVWRVKKKRRSRPNRGGTERLLFHLHR